MPHYRVTIKLENKNVKEFIIDDPRSQIDFVYLDYRKRVYQKNDAGRVAYFDLVMLAEESLNHQEDRKEVFNEPNNFGLSDITFSNKKAPNQRRDIPNLSLEERAKKNSEF